MIVTVLGIGLVCAVLLALIYKLDDEKHLILQLIFIFFIFATLLLIPKAALDENTVCEVVTANETLVGNVTSYQHTTYCYEKNDSTNSSFLTVTQRLYYLVIGYTIVYLAIAAFIYLYNSVKGGRK